MIGELKKDAEIIGELVPQEFEQETVVEKDVVVDKLIVRDNKVLSTPTATKMSVESNTLVFGG